MSTPSLYDTLGVSAEATPEEIRSAYRRKASAHHPDKFTSDRARDEALELMKAVNEANDILSDPERRKAYDDSGSIEKPVDLAPMAATMLQSLLRFAMDRNEGDFIASCRECLKASRVENGNVRSRMAARVKVLQTRRKRVKVRPGVENVVHAIIDQEIAGHERDIASSKVEEQVVDMVEQLLQDYEFLPEPEVSTDLNTPKGYRLFR